MSKIGDWITSTINSTPQLSVDTVLLFGLLLIGLSNSNSCTIGLHFLDRYLGGPVPGTVNYTVWKFPTTRILVI